jgi:hypothetical protein
MHFHFNIRGLCMFAIQMVNGQDKSHCWIFHVQQFPMCIKNSPSPKGHPANLTQLWEALESTWASIPVERFLHLVESMLDEMRLCGGQKRGMRLNIKKVFMFYTLSVLSSCMKSRQRS